MHTLIAIIHQELVLLKDAAYREFQRRMLPTLPDETIVGVRTPDLKKLAHTLAKRPDIPIFLNDLPHVYFEENQLHAFILSEYHDFDECIRKTEKFLPYIDNWATCDQFNPKIFTTRSHEILAYARIWINTTHTYTVRFGIRMLMKYFLDDTSFTSGFLAEVAQVKLDEYYVRMAIAWYFATALTKQYEATLPLIQARTLDVWTHNKAIQKALESKLIPQDRKEMLRALKIRALS